jgi:outer membrane protein TolC
MTTHALLAALLLAQTPPPTPTTSLRVERTLGLEEALREAQARNLDLVAARARLDQSKELHWKAWSFYLPQVTAGGTFTHNNLPDVTISIPTGPTTSEQVLIQKQDQLAAQIQATQAIFAPEAWFGISAARAGERGAADSVESFRRDVLFGVAQAYYAAASLKQVVTIQERQLVILLDHERDAKIRYDAGATPKVTLLRAQIDRARSEQDLKRAQNAYLASKLAIATLLDRDRADFEVEIPPSPPLPANPEALREEAPHMRPDVQAAQEQITVSENNERGTLARYLPTLGAFGRYQYANVTGFTGDNTSWAVGLALNWNILDGFLRESDLRENRAKVREAQANSEQAVLRARSEVDQARIALDSAVANRQKAGEELALARETQSLVNVNYKAGAATYLEVSDANLALVTAELSQVSEVLRADLAGLALLKAAGRFDLR